tara:strand:+ start:1137 stop:2174 length:1038 start_codon:yes stop_codon:yes gene_type:complete
MQKWRRLVFPIFGAFVLTFPAWAATDLSGTFDTGTLTPLERPPKYGEFLYLPQVEGEAVAQRFQAFTESANAASDPNRSAPAKGGRVGGYNLFWIDRGASAVSIDGKFRTSILTRPANGRIPPMTAYGEARMQGMQQAWRLLWRSQDLDSSRNTGTAWWLDEPGAKGPYDDIEQRPLAERCLLGSRSTAGPPMLPNYYNNHKRIVQTPDHVMILTEMNHDARIIRLNAAHRADGAGTWLGDSVGHWEGETLVIRTKHFSEFPALSGADKNLEVIERLTRLSDGGMLYRFTVTNPGIWREPWGGEYRWASSQGKVYEYACHEGNYALGNILRGARRLEQAAAGGEG